MSLQPKVLVVDDKYYIRQLMITALGLKGYDVLVAADGRDGIEIARRERPRLVLLDLLMPGIDGYETLRLLRDHADTRGIPVVIMSARGDLDCLVPPIGAQDYLLKPFDLEAMEEMVEKYAGPAAPIPAAAPTVSPSTAPPVTGAASAAAAQGEVAATGDKPL